MSGFEELDHTADWALRVWAHDLEGLFIQAAAGMFALMGVRPGEPLSGSRQIEADGPDDESLLVDFLAELLLVNEAEQLALAPTAVSLRPGRVSAVCTVAPVLEQEKEIKAVTYHGLEVLQRDGNFETVIVFDV
ncbi:MAG TPA: archease [Anaerolineales bacterium]|nr:archease [Anaerolineales bacterium]